jgi:pilus assembly protein CpaE
MSGTLPVVLVHRDDYERGQLRAALEVLPGVQVAGERTDLRSGLALARQVRPAVLILELSQPVEDTLHAASQHKLDHPDCAIFLASESFDADTLLKALRAGAQEVLRRPLDRGALREAIERVMRQQVRKAGGAAAAHGVFTVFSNKGGSGVSMLASNLALCFRRQTAREVLLVDFDYQSGDVGFMLGLSPTRSLADVLTAAKLDSAAVQGALMKHESGLYVLSQPDHLDRVDSVTAEQAGSVLDIAASMFDFVVVDAPHIFNDISLEIFDRSSTILLMVEPSIPSVRAARRSLDIFQKLNFMVSQDRVRLVINRRTETSAISVAQIQETLGVSVFGSVNNDYAAVSNSINVGKPLCGESPDTAAGRDIEGLARKLMPTEARAEEAAAEAAPAKRSARIRLFGKG